MKMADNKVKEFKKEPSKEVSKGVEAVAANQHDEKIAQYKYDAMKEMSDNEMEKEIKQMELDNAIKHLELEIQKTESERRTELEEMRLKDEKSLKKTKMITDTVTTVSGWAIVATTFILHSNNKTKLGMEKLSRGIMD